MAFIQTTGYDIRATGTTVNIPDDDIARCMYYLSCVCNVIKCDEDEIKRYCDYRNYWRLSDEEDRLVFVLCARLEPELFDDKCMFQSDAMCGNSANEFYEIGQVRNRVLAVQSIVIAGRTREVNKIMTYKRSWMQKYYYEPMLRLARRFSQPQRHTVAIDASDCIIA
ncbi:unnamed protein product [Didymodactylos carnosus]|uniref:Uncharacterized protein n=1 Tax=Didymodactylos carnosus TaxID=1234261 RepID=A0A814X6Y5_9BILA|nr:unnamed protein product [Didymodactylos carnosus]CAF3975783.1 unnamed protein product [Didymodactylos carnosus]